MSENIGKELKELLCEKRLNALIGIKNIHNYVEGNTDNLERYENELREILGRQRKGKILTEEQYELVECMVDNIKAAREALYQNRFPDDDEEEDDDEELGEDIEEEDDDEIERLRKEEKNGD